MSPSPAPGEEEASGPEEAGVGSDPEVPRQDPPEAGGSAGAGAAVPTDPPPATPSNSGAPPGPAPGPQWGAAGPMLVAAGPVWAVAALSTPRLLVPMLTRRTHTGPGSTQATPAPL